MRGAAWCARTQHGHHDLQRRRDAALGRLALPGLAIAGSFAPFRFQAKQNHTCTVTEVTPRSASQASLQRGRWSAASRGAHRCESHAPPSLSAPALHRGVHRFSSPSQGMRQKQSTSLQHTCAPAAKPHESQGRAASHHRMPEAACHCTMQWDVGRVAACAPAPAEAGSGSGAIRVGRPNRRANMPDVWGSGAAPALPAAPPRCLLAAALVGACPWRCGAEAAADAAADAVGEAHAGERVPVYAAVTVASPPPPTLTRLRRARAVGAMMLAGGDEGAAMRLTAHATPAGRQRMWLQRGDGRMCVGW